MSYGVAESLQTFDESLIKGLCQFRLTLVSATPISTSDQTAKTTIYDTPYGGNLVGLKTDGVWKPYTSAEISIALGTLSSATLYYVYRYDSSGTQTLEISTTGPTYDSGVQVKTGDASRRYRGMFYTTSTTATEDSQAKRFLINWDNAVERTLSNGSIPSTINFTSTSVAKINAGSADTVEFLTHAERAVRLHASLQVDTFNGPLGIGVDTATTPITWGILTDGSTSNRPLSASLMLSLSSGYHYAALLAKVASGTGHIYLSGTGDVTKATYLVGSVMG